MSTHNGHAPGPWATSKDAVPADFTQITVYEEQGGQRVATVFQTEANARLIAAAPELCDLLTLALPYIETAENDPGYKQDGIRRLLRQIREAIAKAEGREG